jgi:hypothetical protein
MLIICDEGTQGGYVPSPGSTCRILLHRAGRFDAAGILSLGILQKVDVSVDRATHSDCNGILVQE